MKILHILILFCGNLISAQTIALGLISDQKTKLSKSFAFYELLSKNKFQKKGEILIPEIKDFVYSSDYGIEGVVYENSVKLNFHKNGEDKYTTIKCANDWAVILEEIGKELETDGYSLKGNFSEIKEGKPQRFYSGFITENLPGKLTIKVPDSRLINLKSVKGNIIRYKTNNPYQEIKDLYGNFVNVDLNEIQAFKNSSVPYNFKQNIKPLFFPISNTLTYSLKLLGFGGVLMEKKDYNAALNCFYTVLNTTEGIVCTLKEKATIKAIAYKYIADIYNNMENRKDLSKIFYLGYEVCNAYSNSDDAQKEFEKYYESIGEIEQVCSEVELNIERAKGAMFAKAMGVFANSLASNSSAFGDLGIDVSQLTTQLSPLESQGSQSLQETTNYFKQLGEVKEIVNTDSFKVEGVNLGKENNYVSSEILNFLFTSPDTIKESLIEFSEDKPQLKNSVNNFYTAKKEDRSVKVKELYKQLYKIELLTITLESKNKTVDEKYKSKF